MPYFRTPSLASASALQALRLTLLAAIGMPLSCGKTSGTEAAGTDSGGSNANNSGGSGGSPGAGGSGFVTAGGGGDGVATTAGGPITTVGTTGSVTPVGLCSNPTERLAAGMPSGFIQCAEGYEVREREVACPNLLPPKGHGGMAGMAGTPGAAGAFDESECETDADCPGSLEYCQDIFDFGSHCVRGCITDADCDTGEICRCDDQIGHCSEATCATNEDCGPASLCASVAYDVCTVYYEYACLRADDECRSNSDCTREEDTCQREDQQRICVGPIDCGRPFLVAERQRSAAIAPRSDWHDTVVPMLEGLGNATLVRLSRHWQRIGLLEHASIAAFARFSLQLLQLGAPADLIERTNQALVDETRHARMAFALASAYGGRPVGPGQLETADALRDGDIEPMVSTVILEGCVGETVAALQAQMAHEACVDPSVRQVLGTIAAEEARHAELAWRFLRWVLAQHPHLAGLVREHFDALLGEPASEPDDAIDTDLSDYGILPAGELSKLRIQALTDIIRPCARALLEQEAPQQPRGYSDFM